MKPYGDDGIPRIKYFIRAVKKFPEEDNSPVVDRFREIALALEAARMPEDYEDSPVLVIAKALLLIHWLKRKISKENKYWDEKLWKPVGYEGRKCAIQFCSWMVGHSSVSQLTIVIPEFPFKKIPR